MHWKELERSNEKSITSHGEVSRLIAQRQLLGTGALTTISDKMFCSKAPTGSVGSLNGHARVEPPQRKVLALFPFCLHWVGYLIMRFRKHIFVSRSEVRFIKCVSVDCVLGLCFCPPDLKTCTWLFHESFNLVSILTLVNLTIGLIVHNMAFWRSPWHLV